MNDKDRESRPVYSTEKGDLRKVSNRIELPGSPATAAQVRVSLDKKGRKGKAVTLITGITKDPASIEKLAKELRTMCGAGGTVEDRDILVQGDHRDRICAKLAELGFKPKKIG